MKKILICAAAALAAAVSCTETTKTEVPYGKELSLTEIYENGTKLEIPADAVPNMMLDSTGISGFASVNRYFGAFKYNEGEGSVKVGPIGTTMMAGPYLEFEQKFLSGLNKARYMTVSKDTCITLLDSLKQEVLKFK